MGEPMWADDEASPSLPRAGADLLAEAVDTLLREVPVDQPGPQALQRLRTVLACAERLRAAQLLAVRDLDARELYALDAAGNARTWLRRQPGGEDGQVTLARRLAQRPHVTSALTAARIGVRTASQLCTALEHVPDTLDDDVVVAVAQDGIGPLLRTATGGTPETDGPDHGQAAADVLTQRAADQSVLDACCADTLTAPAARMEPAFVLLAERLSPADLPAALRTLLDPLQPDGTDTDTDQTDPYYFELRTLLDGDVDLRGHLDAETGQSLAAEIERRISHANTTARQARTAATEAQQNEADEDEGQDEEGEGEGVSASGEDAEDGDDKHALRDDPDDHEHADPQRPISAGRRRHDALRDLLTDAATAAPGQPAPAALTIIASLDAVADHLGALPAQLLLPDGRTTVLPTETLQRLGCTSTLDAVLLDALGNPVGASHTRRMPNRAERRAMHARWGRRCAVHGCTRLRTVPHHVIPWRLSHLTRLQDLIPLCASCHHDIHEGHRTLRLRDGRHIHDHGWTTSPVRTAA